MFKKNNFNQAIEYYNAALYFNSKDNLILNNRAICYHKLK